MNFISETASKDIIFDVIIIGAGPAGLFAAKQILDKTAIFKSELKVLILEKGNSPEERICAADQSSCLNCECCSVLSGGGGAGLFSDGKLILDLEAGGCLENIDSKNINKTKLVNQIKDTFQGFDGFSDIKEIPDIKTQKEFIEKLKVIGLDIKYYSVMHMGTNNLRNITSNFINYLETQYRDRFKIQFCSEVLSIRKNDSFVIDIKHGKTYYTKNVILAVGKTGASWLKSTLTSFGCNFSSNRYFIGVRIETLHKYIEPILKLSYDPKISKTFEDYSKIKTHCVCRNGSIRMSRYEDFAVAGGHTVYTSTNNETISNRSNFNILLSINKDDIPPENILNRFKEINSNKLLVQTLHDFRFNIDSNSLGAMAPQNPNITVIANIRSILEDISEFPIKLLWFLDNLNSIAPGINNDDNLIYAPVIEWWMDSVNVNESMQTTVPNLYAIGDGAGLSQGIVHAAATGIIAANSICNNIGDTIEDSSKVLLAGCK